MEKDVTSADLKLQLEEVSEALWMYAGVLHSCLLEKNQEFWVNPFMAMD